MEHNSRSIYENDQELINENGEKLSDKTNSQQLDTFEEEEDLYMTESDNSLCEETLKNDENYLNFLQIVKDSNVEVLDELITKYDINLCKIEIKSSYRKKRFRRDFTFTICSYVRKY